VASLVVCTTVAVKVQLELVDGVNEMYNYSEYINKRALIRGHPSVGMYW